MKARNVYNGLSLRIGIAIVITTNAIAVIQDNTPLASKTLPVILPICSLFPFAFTISLVAERVKPKIRTICTYCITALTYDTTA